MDKYVIVENLNLKGNVYLAKDMDDIMYIMKIVPYEKNENEVKCLKKLNDICNTKILCYIEDFVINVDGEDYKVIIIEYDKNYIDLMEYVKKYNVKKEDIDNIFNQIKSILELIHERKVLHGSINERNIMINPLNLNVKLIDFGNCKITDNFTQDFLQFDFLKKFIKRYFDI
jgi:serine/threonine protein kinase